MRIVLASASPRRVELLKQFNIEFDIIPSDIDEIVRNHELPEQAVMSLAFEKAYQISKANTDAIVIASDTVVFFGDILGKPKDYEDAFNMLKKLSGKTHEVYTGIALLCDETKLKVVDYEVTKVQFNVLSDTDIKDYLETGEAYDKAGAYGIQGFGALLVNKIDGDYFNVMGLPLSKLNVLLKKHVQLDLMK
ncbi:Maf family protein [Fusibacter bizertensis]|uniref:dTTP/UTP pyrophosphatase n=1 Tax=Fusibacter bizertensis TaxID=1488331 RepID=A0ABT6ND62_9FIRM|nr:Maf family protein [Fusibacter bizertensis]MDH8678354.1 Maf family protein [Fusibacter bizertensis]